MIPETNSSRGDNSEESFLSSASKTEGNDQNDMQILPHVGLKKGTLSYRKSGWGAETRKPGFFELSAHIVPLTNQEKRKIKANKNN